MWKNAVSGTMCMLVLLSLLTFAFHVPCVKAEGTIYIRSDGTVDPPTSSIQRIIRLQSPVGVVS